ncbi:MAG: acyl-CoA mutase large subunit family protein [Thermoprotei archaeon]|jgi:methylmalonyl-CoA mutase N-terminal domain/subunit
MSLFSNDALNEIKKRLKVWEEETIKNDLVKYPERLPEFKNISGIVLKRFYTPIDIENYDYFEKLGFPGEYPFTRGIHATMYRGRIWTMRMFSGYGSPEYTNERLKFLLKHGETGLSLAFDFPTLLGLDADDPLSHGEVGVVGVSVSSLKDMEVIFDGIPMDQVTTNMTINPPAPILLSFYIVAAEKQGVKPDQIGGTTQNDNLKEFFAQKSYVFPPEAGLKISLDVIEYSAKYLPKWNPISISGYHIREAGGTALQELAFTIADGIEYVRAGIERGMDVDLFAPRLSFFFAAGTDLFEEVAKFRAARRMWAKIMKERFNAKKPRSMWMRFHTQTSGVALTAQQPENNIVRVAIQALAAVLGGTQSLHTNSFDEAWALPSEKAAKIALRTQQILAYESGAADVVDPLAGSYYVEWLTDKMEEEAWKIIDRVEKVGGMVEAIKRGIPQREINDSAYKFQKDVEEKRRVIVGVNEFVEEEKLEIPLLRFNQEEVEKHQIARLRKVKETRNKASVEWSLKELKSAAQKNENIMPYVIKAVRVYATLGEIMGTLKEVYGEWVETPLF